MNEAVVSASQGTEDKQEHTSSCAYNIRSRVVIGCFLFNTCCRSVGYRGCSTQSAHSGEYGDGNAYHYEVHLFWVFPRHQERHQVPRLAASLPHDDHHLLLPHAVSPRETVLTQGGLVHDFDRECASVADPADNAPRRARAELVGDRKCDAVVLYSRPGTNRSE